MLPGLIEEFAGRRTPEEIRSCTDRILASFEGAGVRSYVQVLACKRTRACLQADVCVPERQGVSA